jgi:outer membrane lipoprotein-sorting protein
MLVPLMLLALLPGADKDDAEKLFREMEAKVAKAKTLDCAFDGALETDQKGTMKGTLLAGEGNKVRMEMSADLGGMKRKFMVVSDGAKSKAAGDGVPAQPAKDTPKWLGEAVRVGIGRGGVMPVMMATGPGRDEKEFKVDDHFQVGDFKLGKKEMVDNREAQVVQYTLTMKQPKEEKIEASVWIDTKTHLPLKHVFTGTMDGRKVMMTETFTKFEVDGKIDAKQFELPKD